MIYFLLTLIIIYYLIYKFNQKDNIENFYTLFQPYYDPNTIKKYNALSQNLSSMKQYNVTFYINLQQLRTTHFKLFLKSLIAYKNPIIHVDLLLKNNDRTIIKYINDSKNKNEIGIVPGPILANEYINNNYQNLQYLTSLNEQYIFLITPINKNLDTIEELNNKIIGVGEKNGLWHQCANDIFNSINIPYVPYFNDMKLTLQALYNGKIDGMLITDSFPGVLLNDIIYNFYNLQLISLDKIHHLDFYYTKTQIDLTKTPSLYVPQPNYRNKNEKYRRATLFTNFKQRKDYHHFFNSAFTTYKFSNYIITNNHMDDRLAYLIVEHLFNNKLLVKKSENAYLILPIPFNKSAKKYYMDKGYMTNEKNLNCIYLYGKERCTQDTLKKNLLNQDAYYNLL